MKGDEKAEKEKTQTHPKWKAGTPEGKKDHSDKGW